MGCAAEVDHPAAVVTDLQQKIGMVAAKLRVNGVIGLHCVITDVGRVRALDNVIPGVWRDRNTRAIGWRMGMIAAYASLSDEISVVLQHVEAVIVDKTVQLALRISLGVRNSDIDRLTFEWLRLPVLREVRDGPIRSEE